MGRLFTFEAQEERRLIVAFLHKYTHLEAVAQLIAAGMHREPPEELRAFCAEHKINLKS